MVVRASIRRRQRQYFLGQQTPTGEASYVGTIVVDNVAGAHRACEELEVEVGMFGTTTASFVPVEHTNGAMHPDWAGPDMATLAQHAQQIDRMYGPLGDTFATRTTQVWRRQTRSRSALQRAPSSAPISAVAR